MDAGSIAVRVSGKLSILGPLRKILTTFSAQPAQFDQISVSGGPTEVVVTFDEARITASGSRARA